MAMEPPKFIQIVVLRVLPHPGFTVNVETTKTGNVWAYVVSEAGTADWRSFCPRGIDQFEKMGLPIDSRILKDQSLFGLKKLFGDSTK